LTNGELGISAGGATVSRIVLVTGGGNGLGKAVAARFLADGDTVIITGRNA
jgi:3-oxoacyl-[acyl-carrier protein] reductase